MSPRSSKKTKTKKKSGGAAASNKPGFDVYVGLLMAGFLAVVIGCSLLAVELSKYDWTAAT